LIGKPELIAILVAPPTVSADVNVKVLEVSIYNWEYKEVVSDNNVGSYIPAIRPPAVQVTGMVQCL
jgi:hypothetical protein